MNSAHLHSTHEIWTTIIIYGYFDGHIYTMTHVMCKSISLYNVLWESLLLFTHKLHFGQVTAVQITSDPTSVQIVRILRYNRRMRTRYILPPNGALAYTYIPLVAIRAYTVMNNLTLRYVYTLHHSLVSYAFHTIRSFLIF